MTAPIVIVILFSTLAGVREARPSRYPKKDYLATIGASNAAK